MRRIGDLYPDMCLLIHIFWHVPFIEKFVEAFDVVAKKNKKSAEEKEQEEQRKEECNCLNWSFPIND